MSEPTQTITCCDGHVSFELPIDWQSEAEGEGVVYFDPTTDSSALRVALTSVSFPEPVDPELPPVPQSVHDLGSPLERLGDGHWFSRTVEQSVDEDGQAFPFITYYHILAQGHDVNVVLFTSSDHSAEIEDILASSIRRARISL